MCNECQRQTRLSWVSFKVKTTAKSQQRSSEPDHHFIPEARYLNNRDNPVMAVSFREGVVKMTACSYSICKAVYLCSLALEARKFICLFVLFFIAAGPIHCGERRAGPSEQRKQQQKQKQGNSTLRQEGPRRPKGQMTFLLKFPFYLNKTLLPAIVMCPSM